MSAEFGWLPPLICLADSSGIWEEYLEALYETFERDFVRSKPVVDGLTFRLKRYPMSAGKESTFWHFIQEGENETDRTPDLRCCERIGWIRPIIEGIQTDGTDLIEPTCSDAVKYWRTKRNGSSRIVVSVSDFSYVVVLDERVNYVLPWTAYCVPQPHRQRKLQRECEAYWEVV